MATIKVTGSKARYLHGTTDWKKVKILTEAEIHVAAMSDPSSRELKPNELAQFKREHVKAQ